MIISGLIRDANMFEMTTEGYKEAKKYLEEINKLDEFLNNKTSVDGYSLIATANSYRLSETMKKD